MLSVTEKENIRISCVKTPENRQQKFLSSLGLLNRLMIYNVIFLTVDKANIIPFLKDTAKWQLFSTVSSQVCNDFKNFFLNCEFSSSILTSKTKDGVYSDKHWYSWIIKWCGESPRWSSHAEQQCSGPLHYMGVVGYVSEKWNRCTGMYKPPTLWHDLIISYQPSRLVKGPSQ